jgi:hypothetical protein
MGTAHVEIAFPAEMQQLMQQWCLNHVNDAGMSARMSAMVIRFLIVLCFTNDRQVVDTEMLQQAFSISEYEHKLRDLMIPDDANSCVQAWENLIEKMIKKHGRLTTRQLRQYLHPERNALLGGFGTYNQAWRNLTVAGAVEVVESIKPAGGGRNIDLWAWVD